MDAVVDHSGPVGVTDSVPHSILEGQSAQPTEVQIVSEPQVQGVTNIVAAAAASRWFRRLVRRVFWQYTQTERSERHPDEKGNLHVRVVEHDTWSKIFGCFPIGRRPIEMRIQRIRCVREKNVSIYVICEPLREVPTFEFDRDIASLHLNLKSARKAVRRKVKVIRRCPVERQKAMATAATDRWRPQSGRPIRRGWDEE